MRRATDRGAATRPGARASAGWWAAGRNHAATLVLARLQALTENHAVVLTCWYLTIDLPVLQRFWTYCTPLVRRQPTRPSPTIEGSSRHPPSSAARAPPRRRTAVQALDASAWIRTRYLWITRAGGIMVITSVLMVVGL